jgi:hypothetical protein
VGKPCELSGEVNHAAFLPVAVMGGNGFSKGFDQTSAVRAKNSQYQ